VKWKPVGRDAVIIYFADKISDDSLAWSLTLAADLEQNPPAGLKDYIPAYTSVLLQFDPHREAPLQEMAKELIGRWQNITPLPLTDSSAKEIPVTYNGDDLARVAAHTKLSREEIISLHSATTYRVALIGFTPGFPYLSGLDERLHTPRLAKPRVQVKTGAVGIGGAQTGIYTVDGPGGWNIIGHTATRVYDPSRSEPFLLKQGDRVKFVPTG
jgi:inhibitor of KinA